MAVVGWQEMQVLRLFSSQRPGGGAAIVGIRGAFSHAGHLCLVLERLGPTLLDYTISSAGLPAQQQLTQLRKIAFQLLVGPLVQSRFTGHWNTARMRQRIEE